MISEACSILPSVPPCHALRRHGEQGRSCPGTPQRGAASTLQGPHCVCLAIDVPTIMTMPGTYTIPLWDSIVVSCTFAGRKGTEFGVDWPLIRLSWNASPALPGLKHSLRRSSSSCLDKWRRAPKWSTDEGPK